MTETGSEESKLSVLQQRAKALAAPPARTASADGNVEVIEFQISDEIYAIESKWVREVYPLKDLTPVPCTPTFVLGIVNIRGQILAVIDLGRFFDLPLKGLTNLNQVIVLKSDEMELGILADAILRVRQLAPEDVQTRLPTLSGVRARYLRGVTNDQVVVIDAQKLLSASEIVVNDQIEAGQ